MLALFNIWVTFWLQGRLCQCPEHKKYKCPTKEQHRTDLGETDTPLITDGCRHNGDIDIQIMANEDNDTRHYHKPINSFKIAVHQ